MITQEQIYKIVEENPYDEMTHKHAVNMEGKYIGLPDYAEMLLTKFDIHPETIGNNEVCSIGFSPRDNKWYGWSHRALYGFGVGSTVLKGDCGYVGATPEELIDAHSLFYADISDESAKLHREECQVLEDRTGIRILHAPLKIPLATSIDDLVDAMEGETAIELEEVDLYEDTPFTIQKCGRGEWVAETMEDAKQMATDFANGVA